MKFSRIGKCVIALALVIAVSVTAVSAMSASGNTNVSSDDMTFSDYISVSVENKTSSEMTVVDLDDKTDFNIDTDDMSVEEVLKLLAAKAKEITSQNDIIKLKMEWPAFGTMPYHALCQCIVQNGLRRICQGDISSSEPVMISFNLKLHPEYSEGVCYLVFLYLLTREYSDNVLFTGYYYDPIAFSSMPPTRLFVCNEYAQHGYKNIKDYHEAIKRNSSIAPVGAFEVDFASKEIIKLPFDPFKTSNVYEDIFDIPASAGKADVISEKTDAAGRKTIELDKSSFALYINSNMSMESIFKVLAAKAEEITDKYDLINISVDNKRSYSDALMFINFAGATEHFKRTMGEMAQDKSSVSEDPWLVYHWTYNVKDYPEHRNDVKLVVFLYLLNKVRPVVYNDSESGDSLFVCKDYLPYCYDSIEDYYANLKKGNAPLPRNAYLISVEDSSVMKFNGNFKDPFNLSNYRKSTDLCANLFTK